MFDQPQHSALLRTSDVGTAGGLTEMGITAGAEQSLRPTGISISTKGRLSDFGLPRQRDSTSGRESRVGIRILRMPSSAAAKQPKRFLVTHTSCANGQMA